MRSEAIKTVTLRCGGIKRVANGREKLDLQRCFASIIRSTKSLIFGRPTGHQFFEIDRELIRHRRSLSQRDAATHSLGS